ncbi:MAG: hypothetical protein ACLGI7_18560 [Gammaproteobacteria bacterium]
MTFLDQLSPGRKLLWLDYTEYAGALLAGGTVPWLDVAALLAWQRKAQALLRSDVIGLPVGVVCAAWTGAHQALCAAMAAKARTLFPLKTLLADSGLCAHLVELAEGLRASFTETPLALVCPSPRRWAAQAYAQAHRETPDIDEDDADSAAVLIADFLRLFGESGVDVLLIEDACGGIEEQPMLNVAAHYRWEIARHMPQALSVGAVAAAVVPETYWSGNAEAAIDGPRYARIPSDARPEAVLERLSLLR